MAQTTKKEKETALAKRKDITIPEGKDLIRQWKRMFKNFPEINHRQAQCIELITDYVKKGLPIRTAVICKRIGMDHRTFYNYVDKDLNFTKALDTILMQYSLTAVSVMIGKLSHKAIHDTNIKPWIFDSLAKVTGKIQPNAVNVNVQNNIVTNINPDGSISFESEDRE